MTPPATPRPAAPQSSVPPDTRATAGFVTSGTSTAATSGSGSTRSGKQRHATSRRIGAGLVSVPLVARRDPSTAVLVDPAVPEEKRFCGKCGEKVGRKRDDRPGRPEGFCPACGQRFSFTPKLVAGDLVGQYEVAGCLAHGGLGWVYLATDKRVSDRWVVLKGLLDSGDAGAAAVAMAEARFLAEVEHPNIVRIYNFVEHQGASYIVMEYVGGLSLKDQLKARREAAGGVVDPMPPEMAIAYILEVLPAFGYLHEHNLVFNDFKPDNVIETPEQVKLIDLGAVIRMGDDDADIYGTVGYQAPEVATVGSSVESDLYTVARTLAVLATDFRGYQSTYAKKLPDRSDFDVYQRFESLYLLLTRATALDPDDRFHSADEMAEQLVGVLREVLAAGGDPRPAPSRLFAMERRSELTHPDWRSLPSLLSDPDDPAEAYLAALVGTDPEQQLRLLDQAPERSVGIELATVRALIYAAAAKPEPEYDGALECLNRSTALHGRNWRSDWYRGLIHLATDTPADAAGVFESVLRYLPGELAPKLALATALELAGKLERAATYYDVVSRTDPSFTTACAGLARCRVGADDRGGAVEAFDRIPVTSASFVAGQVEAIRVLTDEGATLTDVERSVHLLGQIQLPTVEDARLRMYILEYALAALDEGKQLPDGIIGSIKSVGSDPEHRVRLDLEAAYRVIGRASEGAEKIEYIDAANAVRPRTWT
ncbi:serine/threonine-protein kinase [Smaragdicoccus niigatensis]|uniref:serine/threonine-protein kinase n=1 Tax=Smaragdicoccus niigatensis TaxID=359359 RepID=UPI001B7F7DA9|nr:serine/threonine-protein kinase [Smaragdicoccus niigatensis]